MIYQRRSCLEGLERFRPFVSSRLLCRPSRIVRASFLKLISEALSRCALFLAPVGASSSPAPRQARRRQRNHVGYGIYGEKIAKTIQRSEIGQLLSRMDSPDAWRTITDAKSEEEITLSARDLEVIQRIRQHRYGSVMSAW